MSDSSRLDALELAVARLTRELVSLRREVRALAEGSAVEPEGTAHRAPDPPTPLATTSIDASSAHGASTSAPFVSDELRRMAAGFASDSAEARASRGRPSSHWDRPNIEAFIGRYGTLALAAFTILMGVGAFIGWAVRNGIIGPAMRVILGALLAGVVAAVGWRLRRGDSPRFGSVLLALSLAIMHVVCWGAGPLLHLVPDVAALGVASAASAGLALLALREEDQSLFNVGFGGALLAPFVTSAETGDPVLLLLYGAIVLGAGMRAMRARVWSKTPFVLGLGVMAYAATASGKLSQSEVWVRAGAPSVFAIAVGWLALLFVRGASRERLATVALITATLALLAMHERPSVSTMRYMLAATIVVSGFLMARGGGAERVVQLVAALLLPAATLVAALATAGRGAEYADVALAVLWAAGSAGAAAANRDGAREWHAFMAAAMGGVAIALQFDNREVAFAVAIAVYGAAMAIVMRRLVLRGVGVAALGWLAIGAAVAFDALGDRGRWITNPFLTPASGAALAICSAWVVFSWHAARTGAADGGVVTTMPRTVVRILGGVLTFLWIHAELSRTVSLDVSTFLLVAYYAMSGVVAIGLGRWRGIPMLRQLGLALAVFAAVKAMAERSSLSIGWRVGGYLLAGVFLLGVAYWYRGKGGEREGAENAASPT
ncbi:MAG TPA: DUF2339 domain-containing protein [Gemmatimonadaceae bacterium]|nr:DUF2339 domain-containing protein [Gemmatimonadaceae bacterium]